MTFEEFIAPAAPVASRANLSKVDPSFLYVEGQMEQAKVWMYGCDKYTKITGKDARYNWQKLWGNNTVTICVASILRHTFDIMRGNPRDKESGLLNAACIKCNCDMLIKYLYDTGVCTDPFTYDGKIYNEKDK